MEQYIGIIICICMCLFCALEISLLALSIYKKRIISIPLHLLGTIISGVLSVFLIAFIKNVKIPIESNGIFLAIIIVSIVFFVAISIKSFFVDANGIDFRIKAKREKLKEIKNKQKNDDDSENYSEKSEDSLIEVAADNLENKSKSDDEGKENKDDNKAIKEASESSHDKADRNDNLDKDSKDIKDISEENDEEGMQMVKRSKKRSHSKKKYKKK